MNKYHKPAYYVVNGITFYRLIAAPVLLFFIFNHQIILFSWLLPVSFFSDLIDGYIARRFKAVSIFGARLDSIADDLTILTAIIGLVVLKPDFIKEHVVIIAALLILFALQNMLAFIKYHKQTSFHTYSAKVAAILQGVFLILIFLLPQTPITLFYLAAGLTIIDLIEEIVITIYLPEWETDVKGMYWILKKRKHTH